LPFVSLFLYKSDNTIFIPAMGAYLLAILTRNSIDRQQQVTSGLNLWIPVSAFFLVLIALTSWFKGISKQGYNWKGRHYS
jgi:hypothetical protein